MFVARHKLCRYALNDYAGIDILLGWIYGQNLAFCWALFTNTTLEKYVDDYLPFKVSTWITSVVKSLFMIRIEEYCPMI